MFLICSKADERVNLELPSPRLRPPLNPGEVVANKTGISDRDSLSLKDDSSRDGRRALPCSRDAVFFGSFASDGALAPGPGFN
jgi:hypothetical protein